MRILNLFVLLFCLFVISSCGENKGSGSETTSTDSSNTTVGKPSEREFTTTSGQTLVVSETHPRGASLSDITVYFKNDTTTRLSATDKDPVVDILKADLDKNGFDELYIITSASGSGSYGNVVGFNSNNDKSLSFVYLPEVTEKDFAKGALFADYEGHDKFSIENDRLVRTFHVKGKEGQAGKVTYELKKSEAGFVLSPVK